MKGNFGRKKTKKEFICQTCNIIFPNKRYQKLIKFCSPECYRNSLLFIQATLNGGKAGKGRKIYWGDKIALSKLGKPRYDIRKEKNPNWKGGITEERQKEMQTLSYKEWRRKVFERDNYICQICGDKNGNGKTIELVAHHRQTWKNYPELRYDIDNGMTICKQDHIIGHQLFGFNYA